MGEADFRRLVREMRYAQTRYFRDRTTQNLRAAKHFEAQVDAELQGRSGPEGAPAQMPLMPQ